MTQRLDKLRVLELSFIRQGKPAPELAGRLTTELDRFYPADNEFVNRELSQLLIYLDAPDTTRKTLSLLDQAKTQEEQAHYIFYLRTLTNGWTLDQRKHYFDWFRFAQRAADGKTTPGESSAGYARIFNGSANERHPAQLIRWFKEAGRDYSDGASYAKYLVNFRNDAVATLSETNRLLLSSWIQDYSATAAFKPQKERHLVKEWKMADLESSLGRTTEGRSFADGKAAFHDGQCVLCHRFQNTGGSVGPELTAASSKYTRRDILESILEPSKVVSEQYQNYTIIKTDGDSETGRIVDENDEQVVVQPSPLLPERMVIKKSYIRERRPSKVSPMPEGLVNQMTEDEILDLIAYLTTGGKEDAVCFKRVEGHKN